MMSIQGARSLARSTMLATSLVGTCVAALGQETSFYDETHLPVIELTFKTTTWRQELEDNFRANNGEYVEADLRVDGVFVPRVGVQHKGDASYRGDFRENMKITLDAFVPGQDVFGYDKITVDSGEQTNVFTEVAALWVMSEFQEVPLVNLAHVVAVDPAFRRDLGVFTNTERVDGRFVDRRFVGDGHRYWHNFSTLPFGYRGPDVSDYYNAYVYEGGDPATQFTDVAAASIALQSAGRAGLRADLEPFMDVDACLRNIIANRLLGNFDGLEVGNNFYLGESVRHGGRMSPVPWDMDFSFTSAPQDPVPNDADGTSFPLKKAFSPIVERERAYTFVQQFLERSFQPGVLFQRLTRLEELALPAMLGSKFDPIDSRQDADAAVDRSIRWIDNKRDQLEADPKYQRIVPRLEDLEHHPESPVEGETVWVTVQAPTLVSVDKLFLWSRTRGGFRSSTMKDDGQHEDGAAGDGIFGAALLPAAAGEIVQYYVELRPTDVGAFHFSFEPEETSFAPREVRIRLAERSALVLNELLADNEKTDYDEFLEPEDWIEIANHSGAPLDLGGYGLSDDLLRPYKWVLPTTARVPSGGFLRVWADDEVDEGPLHAAFKLGKAGGAVFLREPDPASGSIGGGALVDEVDYGAQRKDHSFGRVPDGTGAWFYLWDPTALVPVVVAGDDNRYDVRSEGSSYGLDLERDGKAKVGEELRLEIFDGTPNGFVLLLVSLAPAQLSLRALGPLLVDPRGWLILAKRLDASGEAKWKVDVSTEFGGLTFYAQALERDSSNGLVVEIAH